MSTRLTTSPSTPPRTSFRTLTGAMDRRFLVLDIGVRLPTAMLPLGLLLYVADRTGSYGTGGLAVAALSIGGAVGGSMVGLTADRFGQRLVGLLVTLVQAAALLAFLVLGPGDVLPVTLGLAALIGLSNPQAGAMARSRWAALARTRSDRRSFTSTAMAWEGALDESSFVVGPVLISTVAALTEPTWVSCSHCCWRSRARPGSRCTRARCRDEVGRAWSRPTPPLAEQGRHCPCSMSAPCSWPWPRSVWSSAPRRPVWRHGWPWVAPTS